MSYLGQTPVVGKFQKIDNIASSFNDSTTSFSITSSGNEITPGTIAEQVLISIDGVLQEPSSAYTLSGSTITFTEAPNTNASFFGIVLGDVGIVNTLSDGVIPSGSLQANSVTHTKVAADAIGTPQIKDGEVTIAKLTSGTFPVNAANLATDAVETAKIKDDAVTNLKISPNVVLRGTTTFMGAAIERANVIASNIVPATIDIDNQHNGVIFFTANSHDNTSHTVNFINMDHVEVGNATSFVVMVTNNVDTQANINAVQINGDASNNFFYSGGLPVTGSSNIDVYSFSVIKTGTSAYTTIASLTNFT